MIELNPEKEPYDLALPYGIVAKVNPLTTASMLAAQAAARKAAEQEIKQAGGEPDGDIRDGLYQAHLIYELACRHITKLQGVELKGEEAPATPENIKAIMDMYPVGERFYQIFTAEQVLLNASKNVSRPSAGGTSKKAAGRNTAKAANT